MAVIEHDCPHAECGVRLSTTLRNGVPQASWGVTSVPVRCPSCLIKFGLWVPMNQAGYVDTTARAVIDRHDDDQAAAEPIQEKHKRSGPDNATDPGRVGLGRADREAVPE